VNPPEFVKTVYLGDRAVKAITIDCWNARIAVQVDVVSRLRPGTDRWDFYTAADVRDGLIVFTGVTTLSFHPPGPLPNDTVNDFTVVAGAGADSWRFELSVGTGDGSGTLSEVTVTIEATAVHIEDPAAPGVALEP